MKIELSIDRDQMNQTITFINYLNPLKKIINPREIYFYITEI